jgi:hypothetical protein
VPLPPPRPRWGLAALGLAVAVMMGALMFVDIRDRHALSTRGLRTEAEVLRVDREESDRLWLAPRITFHPVFRFTTADGQAIERRGTDQVDAARVLPGQRLVVVYDPSDPRLAREAARFDADTGWMPWIVAPFLLLGLAVCVVAVVWPGRLPRP